MSDKERSVPMLLILCVWMLLRPTYPLLLIQAQAQAQSVSLLADLAEFPLHVTRLRETVARATDCTVCACRVRSGSPGNHLGVDGLRADFLPLLLAGASGNLLLAADLEHPLGNQLPFLLLDVFLGFLEVLDLVM